MNEQPKPDISREDQAFLHDLASGKIHGDVVHFDKDGKPIPRKVYYANGKPPQVIPTP